MRIHIYQIAVTLVSLAMIYQGVSRYMKGGTSQTFIKVLLRIVVWGGMAAIAVFPDLSNVIASTIGIAGNINAVILIGFLLVFLMMFKLLSAIERLEQDLSLVVRKDALSDIDKK